MNLLRKLDTITNRLVENPDYKPPGPAGLNRTIAVELAVVALLFLALFFIGGGPEKLDSGMKRPEKASGAPRSVSAKAQEAAGAAEPAEAPAMALPPAIEKQAPVAASDAEKPLAPVISRPVAKDLDALHSQAVKPAPKKGVWKVRFAICNMEQSCREVMEKLAAKGVPATLEVEKVEAAKTLRVVLGPWPTAGQAEQAISTLREKGVEASLFSTRDKYFILSKPQAYQKEADQTLETAKAAGFEGKSFYRRETRDMFKVFGEKLKSRERAEKKAEYYKRKGIDCYLEEG